MVFEFMELEYHGKILKFFYGTRVPWTRVPSKNFRQFWSLFFQKKSSLWNLSLMTTSSFTNSNFKKIMIAKYFTNSGILQKNLQKSSIWQLKVSKSMYFFSSQKKKKKKITCLIKSSMWLIYYNHILLVHSNMSLPKKFTFCL